MVDHVVPVAAGGSWFDPANLQGCCRSCNTWKAYRQGGPAAGVPLGPREPVSGVVMAFTEALRLLSTLRPVGLSANGRGVATSV